MSGSTYYFASSLRQGLTAAIGEAATGHRASFHVRLTVAGDQIGGDIETVDIDQTVDLYGPGDIVGFKSDVITRTEPKANVGDFEPNYFPMVEFANPDFLWRFTADVADNEGRLIPWISLVVLIAEDRGDFIHREFDEGTPPNDGLPRWINVREPNSSLPDLAEAWQWSHVQAIGNQEGIYDTDNGAADINADLIAAVADAPDRVISRLMCPRRLKAGTLYAALIVPTFELGRCAGLGLEPAEGIDAHTKSWAIDQAFTDGLRLPYYYRWEFRTGQRGDFERLVRLLVPRNEIPGLGDRPMNCATPGYGISGVQVEIPGADPEPTLGLEGALRPVDLTPTPWGLDAAVPFNDFRIELASELLNLSKEDISEADLVFETHEAAPIRNLVLRGQPNVTSVLAEWETDVAMTSRVEYWIVGEEPRIIGDLESKTQHSLLIRGLEPGKTYQFKIGGTDAADNTYETPEGSIQMPALPSVTPPIYGCWHAAEPQVDPAADTWLHELNLDPRHRVASGFGSEVVRKQQEPLMASAWEQLGAIESANNLLRRAQLGRDGSNILWERLGALGTDAFLQVTAPVHARTRPIDDAGVVSGESAFVTLRARTQLPRAALTSAFRRLASPRSPLRKRQNHPSHPPRPRDIIQKLATGTLRAAGPPPKPAGMASICDISEALEAVATSMSGGTVTPGGNVALGGGATPTVVVSNISNDEISAVALDMSSALTNVDVSETLNVSISGIPADAVLKTSYGTPLRPDADSAYRLRTGKFSGLTMMLPKDFSGDIPVTVTATTTEGTSTAITSATITVTVDTVVVTPGAVTSPTPQVRFCDDHFQCLYLFEELQKGAFQGLDNIPDPNAVLASVCPTLEGWLQHRTKQEPSPEPAADLITNLRTGVLKALHPKRTILKRVQKRIRMQDDVPDQDDPLDPIMWAPEFPQPMYEPLRDLSQDLILPGVEKVPQNTVALLKTNRRFFESYMVGLNHAFAGELLWRQYPTDQRGSYFRQFWDVRDRVPTAEDLVLGEDERHEKYLDVEQLHLWRNDAGLSMLGENPPENASGDSMVLLIRGDLLKKYPNTVIYAVKGILKDVASEDPNQLKVPALREYLTYSGEILEGEDPIGDAVAAEPPKYPIFKGELPTDLTFFGFDFDATAAAEYFFIIEERIAEARYGLDMPAEGDPVAVGGSADLAWDHFETDFERADRTGVDPEAGAAGDPSGRADGWHLDGRSPNLAPGDNLEFGWRSETATESELIPTPAQIAWMTKQSPVRVAISAGMLLPPPA